MGYRKVAKRRFSGERPLGGGYLYEMMGVTGTYWGDHFTVQVSDVTMLYAFISCRAVMTSQENAQGRKEPYALDILPPNLWALAGDGSL